MSIYHNILTLIMLFYKEMLLIADNVVGTFPRIVYRCYVELTIQQRGFVKHSFSCVLRFLNYRMK